MMIQMAESGWLPDGLVRYGIRRLLARRLQQEQRQQEGNTRVLRAAPVAVEQDAANEQHYEVDARFYQQVLGPHLKYSSGFWPEDCTDLADAEAAMLALTCERAQLGSGQQILELGCGWGSLSLWMAEQYPKARIVAVSNSHGQRGHIEAQARERGLGNLTVITCDMNDFEAPADLAGRVDRIVSVEMFEHMANWRALLTRARGWLKPDGRMFIHIFTHRDAPYRFDHTDSGDFIAQHFFTGGVMPSRGLIRQFPDLFEVESEWTWNGEHYARTARHWLANMDQNADRVAELMAETYGEDARLWTRRWRRFYLATAGLFGNDGGRTWAVSHYRLKPVAG